MTPLASIELLHRLTQVGIAYTIARMRVIEARSGESIGVRRYGDAAALLCRQVPSPYFNSVVGLRGGQESLVGEIDDWYRENNIKPRFVIAPGDLTEEMGRALAERGFRVTDTDTVLYGASPAPAIPPPDIDIVEVDSPDLMEDFLDALLAGWRIPSEHHEPAKANMRGWLGVADWRLYLARIDGKPAAAAKLFVKDGIGFFPDAATRPEFRGRGLQTALLRHRAAVAASAGAELIYSQAAFGSTSQHNMERIGLRVLCTNTIWTR
ncbi:MAG: GNAT family N-acetyltransferase [Xanthobacteraceae bacterium]